MPIKSIWLIIPLASLAACPAFGQDSAGSGEGVSPSSSGQGWLARGDGRVFNPPILRMAGEPRGANGSVGAGEALPNEDSAIDSELRETALPSPLLLSGAFAFPPTSLVDGLEAYIPPLLPCACGCGIFEVGNGSMLPQGPGGLFFFEWDYQNQNQNWSRHSKAPAEDNGDKALWTSFYRVGLQYLFNERWGIEADLPFAFRYFRQDDGTGTGTNQATSWTDLGDARVKALYTGFFKDMSMGVDFGLKLPTGNYAHEGADRDTQLGTGSTDLILGGYYRTPITPDHNWNAFFQVEGTFPIWIRDYYRPGLEVDASAGINYQGFAIGNVGIIPFGSVLFSGRTSDSGAHSAQPVASGYQRIFLSPGLEIMAHPFMIYGDVEFPVWQNMRGNQLVAEALFKVVVGFSF